MCIGAHSYATNSQNYTYAVILTQSHGFNNTCVAIGLRRARAYEAHIFDYEHVAFAVYVVYSYSHVYTRMAYQCFVRACAYVPCCTCIIQSVISRVLYLHACDVRVCITQSYLGVLSVSIKYVRIICSTQ